MAQLRLHMEKCYDLAREHLKTAATRQKRDYDTQIIADKYEVDDVAYKRNPIQKKLETPCGPFVVIQVIGNCLYKVADIRKCQVIHHDWLKSYDSKSLPN